MGFEPNAGRRLRLVAMTTCDPVLRQELASVLEEHTMSQVPSVELAREIARCPACRPLPGGAPNRDGLCDAHRTRWNMEACAASAAGAARDTAASGLETLMREALTSEDGGTQFLAAYQRQLRALDEVWEAHRRGAVALPASIAEKVEAARIAQPRFLRGGTPRPGLARAR